MQKNNRFNYKRQKSSCWKKKKNHEKVHAKEVHLKSRLQKKTAKQTNKLIGDLLLHYGLAIQRNHNSIEEMRNAIWATFFHKVSTDENPQHSKCSIEWCEYLQHEEAGTLNEFSHKPPLDEDVQEVLRPIYEDLSKEELLQRCLGANTQNNNESFNACIWHLAPKHIFCGKKIVEIAAYVSTCVFNEGMQPLLKIMEEMGVSVGPCAQEFAQKRDKERIATAERRSFESSKEARIARRKEKAAEEEDFEFTEGLLYGAGIDD